MDEYINREAFKQKLIEKGFFPAIVQRALEEMPREDVVPKSVCDKCAERTRRAIERLQKQIANAKSEVAREIFEEIRGLHLHITNDFDARRYEELKKKYEERKGETK